jgi:hypothetical protein
MTYLAKKLRFERGATTIMKGRKMSQQTDEFRAYAVLLAAEHRRIADSLREIEQHFKGGTLRVECRAG